MSVGGMCELKEWMSYGSEFNCDRTAKCHRGPEVASGDEQTKDVSVGGWIDRPRTYILHTQDSII